MSGVPESADWLQVKHAASRMRAVIKRTSCATINIRTTISLI